MKPRPKKFFSYYKPYRGLFIADLSCAVGAAMIALALPLCTRYIMKMLEAAPGKAILPHIYLVGGLMVALVAAYTACHAFIDYKGHVMGAMMEADMRQELFEALQRQSFSFYDEHRTGDLMSRLTHDTFDMAELFHHGPEDLVIALLSFCGATIIMISLNPMVTGLLLLFLPVMAWHAWYYSGKMRIALRNSQEAIGHINACVEGNIAGIRVVQSFTNEELERTEFVHYNENFIASRRTAYKSEAFFYDGLVMYNQLLTVAVVIFGATAIAFGQMDLADLITFVLYLAVLTEPVQRLGNFMRLYQEGMAGFHRVMDILEQPPSIIEDPQSQPLKDVKGEIEFKNVSFRYRDESEHVLKNLFLKIRKGEYVALVGASGVGKTTLCSLIPRFYDVNEGAILLDGKDIRSLTLASLRSHIGVVQQEVYLFAGTVIDNIRYGKPGATTAAIISAARQAQAHDFIMALPKGYETDIGEKGVKLSGGQRQRLSLARLFLKDPAIIIFDEATSALDNASERAVQRAFETLRHSRTTLVIAHRLSTVRQAERILVLTEEGIAEEGSHYALMAHKGLYADLYNMQASL